jgi:regulator of replication initiation timing
MFDLFFSCQNLILPWDGFVFFCFSASSGAAADVSPLMMPAHEMAGTFAVKKTARGAASGALLEQGASLAPPSSNDTFSDFHKFVAQYADSDLGKELKQAEKEDNEPKKRGRHRRHLEARARMLSDIKNVDHRGRLRKARDRADTRDAKPSNTGSRASSSRGAPATTTSRSSTRSSDFARRADAIAGTLGGGGGGGATNRGGQGGQGGQGGLADTLKTQLERAQADSDEYKAEVRALRAENESLRADNVKLSAKLSEAKLARGGANSKTTDEKVEKYKSKVAKLEEDVKKYKAERDRAKKERDDYKARARNAENDLARRSTTPSSTASVPAPAPTADYDDHYTPGPSFEQYDDDGADQKWED